MTKNNKCSYVNCHSELKKYTEIVRGDNCNMSIKNDSTFLGTFSRTRSGKNAYCYKENLFS
jgi:hypothetical protein